MMLSNNTNTEFIILLLGASIIITFFTPLLVRGFLGIDPQGNDLDQPDHLAARTNHFLQLRTWVATCLIIIIIAIGTLLIINRGLKLHPESGGIGGKESYEMPYDTVDDLRETLNEKLVSPEHQQNAQTYNILSELDIALASYQNNNPPLSYKNWRSIQELITYLEKTEEKLPELSTQIPEYNAAKTSLINYLESNAPYTIEEESLLPFKWPAWFLWIVWFKWPVWSWLGLWILGVGGLCCAGIFLANRAALANARQRHGSDARTRHRQQLETAVTEQLRNHHPKSYLNHFLFTRNDPRPHNNGYFFTVTLLDRLHTQPLLGDNRHVASLCFTINQTGIIEDPIFEVTIQYQRQNERVQITQEISDLAYANLIRTLNRNLSNKELDDLSHEMRIPPAMTARFSHEEKTDRIVQWLLRQSQICALIEWLQQTRPEENWLRS